MERPIFSEIGRADNVCPHCSVTLAKLPSRKTKCTSCGAFILVRTRPLDRKRVLVTEEEALRLETEWAAFREFGPVILEAELTAHKVELEKHRRQILKECLDAAKVGVRVGVGILPSPDCAISFAQRKTIYSPNNLPVLPLDGCNRFHIRGCACCYTPIVLK